MLARVDQLSDNRFVILCLGRTGSSHLVELLDSHPDIRCYAEIVSESHPEAPPDGSFMTSGHTDLPTHLDEVLNRATGAVGFKLPLNSLRDHPEVSGWLERAPGLRVVRLRRPNTLALLVSRRMLRATLVSQSIYGSYRDVTVTIAPGECLRALERIEAEDRELDALPGPHPTFDISYEDMVAGRSLGALQAFLEVGVTKLTSRYERLRTRSFADTIENWEAIVDALTGTRFEPMLADEPVG